MRRISTLCLLMACAGLAAADDKNTGDEKRTAPVRVMSLTVRKAPPVKPGEFSLVQNGTAIELQVDQPGKFVLGIDSKASKLASFTDDKGNDLNKRTGLVFGSAPSWITEYMTRISPDGERCTFQATVGSAPGKGAEKVLVKGSLVLKCGAGEKTTDPKELALKANEEVKVGAFTVKVMNASQFGSQIQVQCPDANTKGVEFLDSKGAAIKTLPPGRTALPTAPGGKPQHSLSYFLTGKADKLSVKVTYFEKVENVTVPLDVRVGLDLE